MHDFDFLFQSHPNMVIMILKSVKFGDFPISVVVAVLMQVNDEIKIMLISV